MAALRSAAAMLLLAPTIAGAQPGDDDAAAQAALARAEVRTILPEVRTIQGLDGSLAGGARSLSGSVETIAGVQRSLASSGLAARMVGNALEVSLPGDVLFDFDRATIRTTAIPTLERVRQAAGQTGDRPVRVEGYTDALGTPAHNRTLSEARARAVADWLVRAGIAPGRITSRGFGADRPVAPNRTPSGADDPAGRQKNRRVTIIL